MICHHQRDQEASQLATELLIEHGKSATTRQTFDYDTPLRSNWIRGAAFGSFQVLILRLFLNCLDRLHGPDLGGLMMTLDSAAQEQEAALPMPDALGVFRLYQMQWLEARLLEKDANLKKKRMSMLQTGCSLN